MRLPGAGTAKHPGGVWGNDDPSPRVPSMQEPSHVRAGRPTYPLPAASSASERHFLCRPWIDLRRPWIDRLNRRLSVGIPSRLHGDVAQARADLVHLDLEHGAALAVLG